VTPTNIPEIKKIIPVDHDDEATDVANGSHAAGNSP